MKGVVFTEFLEMVEDRFSPEIADRIIERAHLSSHGAYTSLGTYDHAEIVRLIDELSEATSVTRSDLTHAFGKHLFGRFVVLYPQAFEGISSCYALLEKIEGTIHAEVRKLYSDAELPKFECDASDPRLFTMIYRSPRGFADLAAGLIDGCIEHFDETIDVRREDLSEGRGTCVKFSLARRNGA